MFIYILKEKARAKGRELGPASGKAEFPLPMDLQDRKALPQHWNNTRGVGMNVHGTGQAPPASLQGYAEAHSLIALIHRNNVYLKIIT